jgi:hypothetical protein
MASLLVTCPACSCAAKLEEIRCPHCGAKLRHSESGVPRTAAAVLLGLSAAVAAASCGDEPVATPVYGIAAVGSTSGAGGSGGSGGSDGGHDGSGGQGGGDGG